MMLGWLSPPAALASCRKRPSYSARSVTSAGMTMVLIATVRARTGSVAKYTTPMAPRPSSLSMRYRPSWPSGACAAARVVIWMHVE